MADAWAEFRTTPSQNDDAWAEFRAPTTKNSPVTDTKSQTAPVRSSSPEIASVRDFFTKDNGVKNRGSIWPVGTNAKTGGVELAWPEFARSLMRGAIDITEAPRSGATNMEQVPQRLSDDALNVAMTLSPMAPRSMIPKGTPRPPPGPPKPPGPIKSSIRAVKAAMGGAIPRAGTVGEMLSANKPAALQVRDILASSASDLPAVRESLKDGTQEILPGSPRTTFQQTGDLGLGQLERQQRTKNPGEFNELASEQNAARVGALDSVKGEGVATDISDFLTKRFETSDADHAANVDALTAKAQAEADALGGLGTPEAHGELIRTATQTAEDARRKAEGALWESIDPDKKIVIDATPITRLSNQVTDELSTSAKPLTGEEQAIFETTADYGRREKFADIVALRSRVSAEMRNELKNGRTPAYARLSALRSAIEDTIKTGAARAQEASGDPENWMQKFQAEHDRLMGEDMGQVPFDAAAQARLKAANDATLERVSISGRGPVKDVLSSLGTRDAYKLQDGRVADKFFHPGPGGFEDATALAKAVGPQQAAKLLSDYAALSLRRAAFTADGMIDPKKFAAWSKNHADALRALPPETQAKFSSAAKAARTVAEAAEERANVAKGVEKSAFAKIMKADNPDDVTRRVGSIFGAKDAFNQMKNLAASVANDPDAKAGLVRAVSDYISGKFMSNTEVATSGINAIKGDPFQTFLRQNSGALSQVYTQEQMKTLRAIASDIHSANRSITANKFVGGPGTAGDVYNINKQGGRPTVLRILLDVIGTTAGHSTGNPALGVLGLLSGEAAFAMRQAGISKIDDLLTAALKSPDLAKALLNEGSKNGQRAFTRSLNKVVKDNAVQRGAFRGTAAYAMTNSPEGAPQ